MKKKLKGSMTVEAAILFPLVLFCMWLIVILGVYRYRVARAGSETYAELVENRGESISLDEVLELPEFAERFLHISSSEKEGRRLTFPESHPEKGVRMRAALEKENEG